MTHHIGQTIAFDYARRTKSGVRSRIGVVEAIHPNIGTITIRETIKPGVDQYRQFYTSAMTNVLVD